MEKKFKELKSGDFIYMISHYGTIYKLEVKVTNDLIDNFRTMWTNSDVNEWVDKNTRDCNIFLRFDWSGFTPISFKNCFNETSGKIDIYNFFKDDCDNRDVYVATTRDEALKLSEKEIEDFIKELKDIKEKSKHNDKVFSESLKWEFEEVR
jgi:hypothetical protein